MVNGQIAWIPSDAGAQYNSTFSLLRRLVLCSMCCATLCFTAPPCALQHLLCRLVLHRRLVLCRMFLYRLAMWLLASGEVAATRVGTHEVHGAASGRVHGVVFMRWRAHVVCMRWGVCTRRCARGGGERARRYAGGGSTGVGKRKPPAYDKRKSVRPVLTGGGCKW